MWTIRTANEGDAAAVSQLADLTFREAYADDNPAGDIERHCAQTFTAERQRAEIAAAGTSVFVAAAAGQLVGYAQVQVGAPAPSGTIGDPGASSAELRRLYVVRSCYGTGLGRALLARAIDCARASRATSLWLCVWERNARAIGFYRKLGFRAIGAEEFVLGTQHQRDLVMHAPLAELPVP
jgi:GNAT superfamily N-acetyltransferase